MKRRLLGRAEEAGAAGAESVKNMSTAVLDTSLETSEKRSKPLKRDVVDSGKEIAAENEGRTGNALLQATKPFVKEDRAKTWRELTLICSLVVASLVGIVALPWWEAKLALGTLLGLFHVRMFIFFHDYCHGAILRKSRAGQVVMSIIGFYMITVTSVWKETHNYHHKNNAKMVGSAIGSYPIVTARMWRHMSKKQRFAYRFVRHPLNIVFGYFTIFCIGMAMSPFRRQPKKHWGGPIALVIHFGTIALLWQFFGWQTAILGYMWAHFFGLALGGYLFYVQHNFPDIQLRSRRKWDYTFAALNSSSMFDMSPVMHWFTGNIGYHHIHHLNHRIPFYRLPEAMAAVPELQSPGRTSWHPKDVAAALRLGVWDEKKQKMVPYAEA